ncbi:MAG: DUF1538 domain-containing protein [Firmicutes bacterium]|nr:DUF1538 domain-containing protein [Bacillota bacterium]
MNKQLQEKLAESFFAVLPITVIVLLFSILVYPMDVGTIGVFLVCAFFLVIGMSLFSLGADIAMMPMGEGIGKHLSKTNKNLVLGLLVFVIGFIITVAEPDLQVLADQTPAIPTLTLIATVAAGVGLSLVIAVLRMRFQIPFSYTLIGIYGLLFILSIFVSPVFLAVSFDAGGVSTGPITAPFIFAMGLGLVALRSDKQASEDSFGLVALCSAGPILAVLLLGLVSRGVDAAYAPVVVPQLHNTREVAMDYVYALPAFAKEVTMAVIPIAVSFLLFQLLTHRFRRRELPRIFIGFVYTLVGLILFLTGVNEGFISVGYLIGFNLATGEISWLLIPLGLVIGYFVVGAEPAVQVLIKKVEELSGGSITQAALKRGLSLGVAAAVAISMIRVLTGISMYWIIIPGYIIALTLPFFVPKIFIGIAYDAGGVAPGPMTACFLLPLAIGACEGVGGNVMIDAFGAVSMVALTPLIAIQIMGLIYGQKLKQSELMDEALETEADETLILLAEEDEQVSQLSQHRQVSINKLRQAAALLYEELHSIIDDDGIVVFDDDTGMVREIFDQRSNAELKKAVKKYE